MLKVLLGVKKEIKLITYRLQRQREQHPVDAACARVRGDGTSTAQSGLVFFLSDVQSLFKLELVLKTFTVKVKSSHQTATHRVIFTFYVYFDLQVYYGITYVFGKFGCTRLLPDYDF